MDNNVFVTEQKQMKRDFMRVGLALSAMMVAIQVISTLIMNLLKTYAPGLLKDSYRQLTVLVLSAICFYLIGFPIMMLILRKVPTQRATQKQKLGFARGATFFFIFMGATYLANLITVIFVMIISGLKGSALPNPLQMLQEGNMFANIVYGAILAPIMEEVIFRGYLLNKLRRYGDVVAILATALAFGLFHGNISQVLYAFVGGLIFAYITVKTGTILYSTILHVFMNSFGLIFTTFVAKQQNLILTALLGMLVMFFILFGSILFAFNVKKIRLEKGKIDIPTKTLVKNLFVNPGMICYYVLSFALIIYMIVIM